MEIFKLRQEELERWLRDVEQYEKAKEEWRTGKRRKPEFPLEPVIKDRACYGIKMTLSVTDMNLIDTILEFSNSLFRIKVEKGRIIGITPMIKKHI